MGATTGRTGRWLLALTLIFVGRVLAQPLAGGTGWGWLPPFDAWQSGALPYPVLLASQILLIVVMWRTARAIGAGRLGRSRRAGWALALFTGLYGGVMVARLVLGLTIARGHWWLDAPLPTVFHLVLTTYLALVVHHHLREVPDVPH
ncbi:MAG: hypothetical protein U0P30_01585 [Vicinamibacterales bacterium]